MHVPARPRHKPDRRPSERSDPHRAAGRCIARLLLAAAALAGVRPAPAAERPARERFVAYAWSGEVGRHDNIVPFHWLRRKAFDADIAAAARAAKAATDPMPPGHRVLFSWDVHRSMPRHPADACRKPDGTLTKTPGIWWDRGAAEVAGLFDAFFAKYKALGGEVDAFVLDHEDGLSNWHIRNDPNRYRAIEADPRFDAVAEQLGFRDLETVRNWRQPRGPTYGRHYRWNQLMARRVAAYNNRAVFEPLRKHFPDAVMSNYSHNYNAPPHGCPDHNGHEQFRFGRGAHVGTHQSGALYASIGQISRRKLDGETPFGDGAWQGFLLSVNRMRSMKLSAPVPVQPWVSHKNFHNSRIRESDLYQELVFHAALSGADPILYWNPRPWRRDQDPNLYADARQDNLVSDLLRRLDGLVGYAGRKTLVDHLAPWDAAYVLTGMAAAGRTVWRFTPRLEGEAGLADTLVADDPPTFGVPGRTVIIPGGRLHRPPEPLSRRGCWILAAPGARPVVKGGG